MPRWCQNIVIGLMFVLAMVVVGVVLALVGSATSSNSDTCVNAPVSHC